MERNVAGQEQVAGQQVKRRLGWGEGGGREEGGRKTDG